MNISLVMFFLISFFWKADALAVTLRQGITNDSGEAANDLRLCFNTAITEVQIFPDKTGRSGAITTNTDCNDIRNNFATFAEDPRNPWTVGKDIRILVEFSALSRQAKILATGSDWTFGGEKKGGVKPDDKTQLVSAPEPTSTLSLLSLGILGAGATLKRKVKRSHCIEKETTKVG